MNRVFQKERVKIGRREGRSFKEKGRNMDCNVKKMAYLIHC